VSGSECVLGQRVGTRHCVVLIRRCGGELWGGCGGGGQEVRWTQGYTGLAGAHGNFQTFTNRAAGLLNGKLELLKTKGREATLTAVSFKVMEEIIWIRSKGRKGGGDYSMGERA